MDDKKLDEQIKQWRAREATGSLMEMLGPYHWCAGDEQKLALVLAQSADPNVRSTKQSPGVGARPLHVAAKNANAQAVQMLIDAGAKHGYKKAEGSTALHMAVENKHEAGPVIEALWRSGAKLEEADKSGATPLAKALSGAVVGGPGGFGAADKLLSLGARWSGLSLAQKHPLHEAIEALREKTVEFMISRKAPMEDANRMGRRAMRSLVQARFWATDPGKKAEEAARAGRICQALLKAGCKADDPDLLSAGLSAHAPEELLAALLAAGAKMDKGGAGSGQYADNPNPAKLAQAGRLDRLLLGFKLGLDLEWRDGNGDGLLHWAMRTRHVGMFETVQGLLAAGCAPNRPNKQGVTPLGEAIVHEVGEAGPKLVAMLIQGGADARLPTGEKQCPPLAVAVNPFRYGSETYATQVRGDAIIRSLVAAGADVNGAVKGEPILSGAQPSVREALIGLGADSGRAIDYLIDTGDFLEVGATYQLSSISQWLKAGAKPEDFISAYPRAVKRMGNVQVKQLEASGAFSYLEALALTREASKPEQGAASQKSLRM
jgi:ankyrin repeat protein